MVLLCSQDWFDDSTLCYDYWTTGGKIGANPYCTAVTCYLQVLPTKHMTWKSAQEMCEQRNARLITLNSYEELQLLRMMLMKYVPEIMNSIFIGLKQSNVSIFRTHCSVLSSFSYERLFQVGRQLSSLNHSLVPYPKRHK